MTMLARLSDPGEWEAYYRYKTDKNHLTRSEEKDLHSFIDQREYLPVVTRLLSGGGFSVPDKKLIQKLQTDKKRTVYLFPREENYVQKLLSFLLLRTYDDIFTDDLYSFRVSYGVGRALNHILGTRSLQHMFSYKVDISDYFNSIDVTAMLHMLKDVIADDAPLYDLFEKMLTDLRVYDNGVLTEEQKGVMAGTPTAAFMANLYLLPLDREMKERNALYARYSDDIIVFAETQAECEALACRILNTLHARGLRVNPKKEIRTSPGETWSFLGVSYHNGVVDVSPIAAEKLKARIRRKARAIRRWQIRKNVGPEQAAKALIRSMNRKYYDTDSSHELTWTRWYFPLINTDKTLHELDDYLQYWIRFLISGKHRQKNYGFRYEEIKALGYRSLVHEWYRKDTPSEEK